MITNVTNDVQRELLSTLIGRVAENPTRPVSQVHLVSQSNGDMDQPFSTRVIHSGSNRNHRTELVQTAIVISSFALDRHCSATMFAVYLLCVSVAHPVCDWAGLTVVRATPGLTTVWALVYRGCPSP